jgi:hypothetical protein
METLPQTDSQDMTVPVETTLARARAQGEIEMCKEGDGRLANLPFPLRVICLVLLLPWIFYNFLRDVVEE